MSVLRPLNFTTGNTLKAVLRDFSTGAERLWSTVTPGFEAYSAGNIANYGISVTEGSPGEYSFAVPATLASGRYDATTYKIAGANLAVGDLAVPVWDDPFSWDGSAVVDALALPNALPGASNGLMKLGANVGNTTFTGASLGQPGLSVDGFQLVNVNWGNYPLLINDTVGTGGFGILTAGSGAAFNFDCTAGGNVFILKSGTGKDIFHATIGTGGEMFNPALEVTLDATQSFNNTGQTTPYPVYAVPSTTGTQPDLDTPALYGRRLRLGINYPLAQTITVANFDASSWTQIDFTVKTDPSIADSASTISIKVTNPSAGTDGLLLLNGAAPSGGTSASDGTITVNTATSSALSVTINLTARGAAIASGNYFAELSVYKASGKQSWLGSMKLDAQQTVRTNPTTS